MRYFIGIDGGGTKTAFAIADESVNVLHSVELGASAYREQGIESACDVIMDGISVLTGQVGIQPAEVSFISMGIPAYGENALADAKLLENLRCKLAQTPFEVVNDVVVGFWGALNMQPGIEVVAGTGSIAYGEDLHGNAARSGGWSEHFSDEGSCYWTGKKAMELFCKQADGREPKSALYDIVRKKYHLANDFDFVPCMEQELLVSRTRTAAFQKELLQAAETGDRSAIGVYHDAAIELFSLAKAVRDQLCFDAVVPVVVTGGMRYADAFLLEPLQKMLSGAGMQLAQPIQQPVIGAVLHARKRALKNLK